MTETTALEPIMEKVASRWSLLRWLGTGVIAIVFAALFVGGGETASAATCDASNNYCFATRWNAVDGIYRCGYGYCDGGYGYLGYGYAPTVYAGYPGAGCALGNYVCDSNGVPIYGAYGYGYAGGVPSAIFANNGCPVGNYACLPGTVTNGCNVGNYSCYYANGGYVYNGGAFTYGNYYTGYGYFPYGSTGVYSGNVTIIAPSGSPYKLGAPYRTAEVAAPVPAPAPEVAPAPAVTTAAPVAAPAAPAQSATALAAQPAATVDAPAQASGLGTHAQSAAAPTTPAFAPEPTGHDARD